MENITCTNKECDDFRENNFDKTNCNSSSFAKLKDCSEYRTNITQKLDTNFRPDRKNPVWVEAGNGINRLLLEIFNDGSCACIYGIKGSELEQRYIAGKSYEVTIWKNWKEIITKPKTHLMAVKELFEAGATHVKSIKNTDNVIYTINAFWYEGEMLNFHRGDYDIKDICEKDYQWTTDRKTWNSFEVEV